MSLKVLEVHHHAMRIEVAPGRPNFRDAPGYWFNVGEHGQVHFISLDGPSALSKGPGQDPTARHIAFAVENIVEAKAEIERRGMSFWPLVPPDAPPQAEMLFVNDPSGNMVEVHQLGACRCNKSGRLPK